MGDPGCLITLIRDYQIKQSHCRSFHTLRLITEIAIWSTDLAKQVRTSRNVAGGWWATWLMGGLNYQVEHHLFPSMSPKEMLLPSKSRLHARRLSNISLLEGLLGARLRETFVKTRVKWSQRKTVEDNGRQWKPMEDSGSKRKPALSSLYPGRCWRLTWIAAKSKHLFD